MTKPSAQESTAVVVRLLDVIGLALLAYLMERMLWDANPSTLDLPLAAVGVVGFLGATIAGDLRRSPLDWPLGLYTGAAIVSSAFSRSYEEALQVPLLYNWQPVVHLVLLMLYAYAAMWLLRRPRRLAVAAAGLVAAMGLVSVMASAEHLSHGINNRLYTYAWLGEWGGYAQLGLLTALGVAFPMAVIMVSDSIAIIGVSTLIVATFVLATLLSYSRSAFFAIVATYCMIACLEPIKLKRMRVFITLPVFGVIAAGFLATTTFLSGAFTVGEVQFRIGERVEIWRSAMGLVRSHPWLGVGLGNYFRALHLERPLSSVPYFLHAHSMFLMVAAESGIPAALAFGWMWWRLLKMSISGPLGSNLASVLKVGCFAALAIVFVKGIDDSAFLSGLIISERMSVLVWTLFALTAAAAANPDRGRLA